MLSSGPPASGPRKALPAHQSRLLNSSSPGKSSARGVVVVLVVFAVVVVVLVVFAVAVVVVVLGVVVGVCLT